MWVKGKDREITSCSEPVNHHHHISKAANGRKEQITKTIRIFIAENLRQYMKNIDVNAGVTSS